MLALLRSVPLSASLHCLLRVSEPVGGRNPTDDPKWSAIAANCLDVNAFSRGTRFQCDKLECVTAVTEEQFMIVNVLKKYLYVWFNNQGLKSFQVSQLNPITWVNVGNVRLCLLLKTICSPPFFTHVENASVYALGCARLLLRECTNQWNFIYHFHCYLVPPNVS